MKYKGGGEVKGNWRGVVRLKGEKVRKGRDGKIEAEQSKSKAIRIYIRECEKEKREKDIDGTET